MSEHNIVNCYDGCSCDNTPEPPRMRTEAEIRAELNNAMRGQETNENAYSGEPMDVWLQAYVETLRWVLGEAE
jgi:hypothetical protein